MVAGAAAGGVVVSALSLGLGLIPYLAVVGASAAAAGGGGHFGALWELELELIQTHMTQKPMLRVEAGARALHMLVKNMCGWTERASAGVQGT